jgi:hypothetical protein
MNRTRFGYISTPKGVAQLPLSTDPELTFLVTLIPLELYISDRQCSSVTSPLTKNMAREAERIILEVAALRADPGSARPHLVCMLMFQL